MVIMIAAWLWPVVEIIQNRSDLSVLPADMLGVGFLGVVTTLICAYIFSDSIKGDGVIGVLTVVGFAADVLFMVAGIFVSHPGVVSTWFRTNGLRLNLIYLASIFLIVFFNLMARRAEKSGRHVNLMGSALKENQATAGTRRNNQVNLIAWVLFPPTIVAALFPGFSGVVDPALQPLPYSEWAGGAQVALIGFALILVKFLLLNGLICRDWAEVWSALALVGNSTAVGAGYVLLRVLLMSQLPFLMGLAVIFVEGVLLLYSYLFILYCVFDLLSFGSYSAALKERREQNAQRARSGPSKKELEREAYERKLDNRERVLNAALGRGPLTDEQAYLMNEMDTKEYVDSELLRRQAIDQHDRKR